MCGSSRECELQLLPCLTTILGEAVAAKPCFDVEFLQAIE